MAPLEWLRQSATRRFDAIQHYSLVENASKRLNVPKRMSGLFMRILLYLAGAVIVSGLILYKVHGGLVTDDGMLYSWSRLGAWPAFPAPGNRTFVVLLPADGPGSNLCKSVVSAVALGYPAPVIINWRSNSSFPTGYWSHKVTKQLEKITGPAAYLEEMTRRDANAADALKDDDLVMAVDAYDVWFQLPPEVLFKRYHEINRQADIRLAKQWGGFNKIPANHSVIISAQKKCWPGNDRMHCFDLPDSPLRKDMYGPHTDEGPIKDGKGVSQDMFHNHRAKYVNSGVIIGTVSEMKLYYQRVRTKLEADLGAAEKLDYADQGIFGEVYGDQEVWRKWRLEQGSRISHHKGLEMAEHNFEFGLSLDFAQQISIATNFHEKDADIIKLNDHAKIKQVSKDLDIKPTRLNSVPADLQGARSPLKALFPKDDSKVPAWGDMPLLADYFTTAVPVLMHHNAYQNGRKARRTTWWDRTWFFPHLRDLMKKNLGSTDIHPVGIFTTEAGDVTYWPSLSSAENKMPKVFQPGTGKDRLPSMEFAEICTEEESSEPWHNEIFRDDKGF